MWLDEVAWIGERLDHGFPFQERLLLNRDELAIEKTQWSVHLVPTSFPRGRESHCAQQNRSQGL
ncbi:hypothetical protein RB6073 [Rhodopirellula baltica SH 1]|uniref:Uncharacterized protein n=1 Tax=Rhodopirellula baltica (strain DSM 10527 / NCIMB 13988 / SH1) TaxID=243090 RepID=Q7UQV0_RHOBA|nr:hypothetical protein RB6073 [Rhodopirellula baltica SH 1]